MHTPPATPQELQNNLFTGINPVATRETTL